jgi:hypothetical protein
MGDEAIVGYPATSESEKISFNQLNRKFQDCDGKGVLACS